MTKPPKKPEPDYTPEETKARMDAGLKAALNTPPKPFTPKKPKAKT